MIFIEFRGFLASFFFKSCGKRLRIQRNVTFTNSKNIIIGDCVTIAQSCHIICGELIEFKNYSSLSPNVCVIGATFEYDYLNSKVVGVGKKIIFGEGAWIGTHVTILGDATIGEASFITPNSFVNRNIPDKTIYGGNPIKKIANRYEYFDPVHKKIINTDGKL
jgi:acetyltransferase-like isoleucine patch superfamily enzyme